MKYLDYMKIQNFEQAKRTLAAMTGTEREEFERTRKEYFDSSKQQDTSVGENQTKKPSVSFEEYEQMIDSALDENIEKLSMFRESEPDRYAEYSEKMRDKQDAAFLKF